MVTKEATKKFFILKTFTTEILYLKWNFEIIWNWIYPWQWFLFPSFLHILFLMINFMIKFENCLNLSLTLQCMISCNREINMKIKWNETALFYLFESWRGGRPTKTISRPSHNLLIFSSELPRNPGPSIIMCFKVSNFGR